MSNDLNNPNPNILNDLPDIESSSVEPVKPKYEFYFRCRACDAILNHNSYNVKTGIQESPYCSRCAAYAFDTSDSDREYEHQAVSDLSFSFGGFGDDYD